MYINREEEIAWWDGFRQGDAQAFEQLYRKTTPLLYAYGCKLLDDPDTVNDLIQNLFLKLSSTRQRLPKVTNVRGYLFRAFRNDLLQQSQSKRSFVRDLPEDDGFLVTESPESQLIMDEVSRERKLRLQAMINELPTRQREAIYLRFYQQLDFNEIAEVMHISQKSVYKILYKAFSSLKAVLRRVGISLIFLFLY